MWLAPHVFPQHRRIKSHYWAHPQSPPASSGLRPESGSLESWPGTEGQKTCLNGSPKLDTRKPWVSGTRPFDPHTSPVFSSPHPVVVQAPIDLSSAVSGPLDYHILRHNSPWKFTIQSTPTPVAVEGARTQSTAVSGETPELASARLQ